MIKYLLAMALLAACAESAETYTVKMGSVGTLTNVTSIKTVKVHRHGKPVDTVRITCIRAGAQHEYLLPPIVKITVITNAP